MKEIKFQFEVYRYNGIHHEYQDVIVMNIRKSLYSVHVLVHMYLLNKFYLNI